MSENYVISLSDIAQVISSKGIKYAPAIWQVRLHEIGAGHWLALNLPVSFNHQVQIVHRVWDDSLSPLALIKFLVPFDL